MVDQASNIYEMVDTSISRSARVAYESVIKTKNDRENRKRGYEGQIEEPYLVKKNSKDKSSYSKQ